MKAFLPGSLCLLGALLLQGCGGSSGDNSIDPDASGLLRQVATAAELEASMKAGLTTITPSNSTALAAGSGDFSSAGFTGTYTQEKNVDEFDAVRYDGQHLYVAPRRYVDCCFVLSAEGPADDTANTGAPGSDSIRILATDPASGTASEQSSIPLDENVSVQGMYLQGDTMFALTAEAMFGSYGDAFASFGPWIAQRFGYNVYDVTDKSAPDLQVEVSIEGVFVESRRIGNTVYIVSRFAPGLADLYYKPTTPEQVAHNEDILRDVTLAELLPSITIDGQVRDLVDPSQCYVTNDDNLPGYPVVTSITAVPIDDPTAFTNTCYNDEVYGAYVSGSAIYFPVVVNRLLPDTVRTHIHKFALAGQVASYRGSAEIDGQLWRGGQADFRMSEHNGELRVVSSIYTQDNSDSVDYKLYVLREAATETALEIVAELPNAARPAEIGKPNELLYGVRFLGERAYAVTFERIDPLYVIDLSDSSDPQIVGELEVTGFSDFLHPVSDDLLLGVGSGNSGGIKLELFDISNVTQPLSRGSMTIGGLGAYSEAWYNRHAFTYQADVNGVDRFALPADVYVDDGVNSRFESSLHLFEIRDKATPALSTLLSTGRITPQVDDLFPWATRHRAFIHDDTVYYVNNERVWSASWTSPTLVNGPF